MFRFLSVVLVLSDQRLQVGRGLRPTWGQLFRECLLSCLQLPLSPLLTPLGTRGCVLRPIMLIRGIHVCHRWILVFLVVDVLCLAWVARRSCSGELFDGFALLVLSLSPLVLSLSPRVGSIRCRLHLFLRLLPVIQKGCCASKTLAFWDSYDLVVSVFVLCWGLRLRCVFWSRVLLLGLVLLVGMVSS